jgi:hypothetical protein
MSRTKIVLLICVFAVAYGFVNWWSDRPVHQASGVLAKAEPAQTPIDRAAPLEKNDFAIKPLARYEITARVLSKESYRWDVGAKLVPVDLTMGWGPMSDSAVLDKLEISQGNRWYNWRIDNMAKLPIAVDQINRHAANMHLIAADNTIAKQIRNIRPGKIVTLRGYLVEASGKDGFTWRTSLSRDDSGGGACELMWVESFSVE